MKKIITLMIVTILLFMMISGCTVKKSSINEEEVLNIYSALEDDQINEYLKGFKELYPEVKINITRDSTGIIAAKLLAEKDNIQADVIWGLAATSLLPLKDEGLLAPYSPKGVERILPEFKDSNADTYWVGIDVWELAFLVNKDVLGSKGITKIPQNYEDLLDPIYKGLIVTPNPASSGTGLLLINSVLSLYGEEKGWEYLDKLDKNIAVYLHSGSAPAKNTATGEYGIGISFGYRCIKSGQDLGDMGVVVFPSEGSGWDLEANALVNKPEGIKDISKKFLDWAISDEMMEKYKVNYPFVAIGVGDNIPEGYVKNPVDQLLPNIDIVWCAENKDRILNEWTKRYDSKSAK